MISTFLNFIGEYNPITTTVISPDGSQFEQVVSGMAGVDWPWIFTALLVLLVLYCLFRIIGGLFR